MRDTEVTVGRDKLISTDAAHVFSSSSSSIPTLALIAISKICEPIPLPRVSQPVHRLQLFSDGKSFLWQLGSQVSADKWLCGLQLQPFWQKISSCFQAPAAFKPTSRIYGAECG